jgi:hypothetical protein
MASSYGSEVVNQTSSFSHFLIAKSSRKPRSICACRKPRSNVAGYNAERATIPRGSRSRTTSEVTNVKSWTYPRMARSWSRTSTLRSGPLSGFQLCFRPSFAGDARSSGARVGRSVSSLRPKTWRRYLCAKDQRVRAVTLRHEVKSSPVAFANHR